MYILLYNPDKNPLGLFLQNLLITLLYLGLSCVLFTYTRVPRLCAIISYSFITRKFLLKQSLQFKSLIARIISSLLLFSFVLYDVKENMSKKT